jgi:outer membrane protein TolC
MLTAIRNAKVWVALLVVLAVSAAPSAQILGGQTPSGTATKEVATTPGTQGPSTNGQQPQIDPYVVGQAKPPATPNSPQVDMSLDQAIQIALENNLDLQSARINPILQDFSLRSFRAAYLPNFSGSFRNNNNRSPVNNNILEAGLTTNITTSQNYSLGVSQAMPWYGGSMSLSFGSGRQVTNQTSTSFNPNVSANFGVTYSQPLLANFRMDQTRNNLRTAPIQRQITDIQLQNSIENTKASVRQGYWTLRQRIESIEIAKRTLELAERQLRESQAKVEIGTVAPIDTTQFEVAVANAQTDVLSAEINWRTQELTFKRLLVNGASDPLYTSTINPTEQPLFALQTVDIQAAVQSALGSRTDLEQSRKQIQINTMNLDITRGSTLPNLTLSGGYSLAGQGGDRLQNGTLTQTSYFGTLGTLTDRPSWNVQLSLNYQLGMVSSKVALARAELQLEQTKTTQKALELTVTSDVTQAGMNVNNTYRQYEARKLASVAAQRNADAAQTRFTAGLASPFEVAQSLQSLTSARLNELNAMIAYLNAVADFDKIQRVAR